MGELAKFPYLTGRRGTSNLYYKRLVPLELRAPGRPGQVWRSLRTSDRKKAEADYGAQHAEVEALFAQWRQDDSQPVGAAQPQSLVKSVPNYAPLTQALLRRIADAHYLNTYEDDFQWRGDLWKKVHEDEDAFWRGDIIKLPEDDWVELKGSPHSYFAYLMEEPVLEEVFLYAVSHLSLPAYQAYQGFLETPWGKNLRPPKMIKISFWPFLADLVFFYRRFSPRARFAGRMPTSASATPLFLISATAPGGHPS